MGAEMGGGGAVDAVGVEAVPEGGEGTGPVSGVEKAGCCPREADLARTILAALAAAFLAASTACF